MLVGSVRLRLVDTAGIREASDQVEALGVARSVEAAQGADLALFVCDGATARWSRRTGRPWKRRAMPGMPFAF